MARILFADDDRVLRHSIAERLSSEGYDVMEAANGAVALECFRAEGADLVILDIEMPKKNGFAVCREIRKTNETVPVIFLTANDSEANEVRALGLGADDFIEKSAGRSEEGWTAVFLAHVARALARSGGDRPAPQPDVIRLGSVTVDLHVLSAYGPGGSERLTETEGFILRLLAGEPGRFFTRDEILNAVHGLGVVATASTFYVHLFNIRHKLGPAAACLESDRRFGVRLVLKPKEC